MISSRFHPRSRRGSIVLTVLIFATVMSLLVFGLLRWSLSERIVNQRTQLRLESRNAAEALAEYGFSQIRQKMEARASYASFLPTGSDALSYPASTVWTGGNIDTSSLELIGGTVNNVTSGGSALYYVDPNDQNNERDSLKGKWVFRRDISVLAKVTALPPTGLGGPSITSYVSEKISVRGAPLFAHAIFYNMDMEIFPGPTMNIYGPVHANGNLYVSSQGNQVNFRGPVTATGEIFHAWKNTAAGTHGTGSETLGTSPVRFVNRAGSLIDLKTSTGVWKDSTMGGSTSGNLAPSLDFRAYASQTWDGNLQTGMHGIQNYTPVAVGKYVEDTTPTDGTDNSVNSGRQIIEPTNWPAVSDPAYTQKMEVEQQKYANDAAIYVRVDPTSKTIVSVTSRSKSDPTKSKTLTLPTGTNKIFTYQPFTLGNDTGGNTSTSVNNPPTPSGGTNGEIRTTSGSTVQTDTQPKKVVSGIYDRRRSQAMDLVEIDMAGLRNAIGYYDTSGSYVQGEMQKSAGSRDATKAIGNLDTTDWTGIVYVEVAGDPTTNLDGTTNAGTAAANTVGVRIVNGQYGVATYGTQNPGLTIATNSPLYVKGHYNADGSTSTGGSDPSQSSANRPETNEVPAALVADAVTLLSPGFDDSATFKRTTTTTTTTPITKTWKKISGSWQLQSTSTGTAAVNTAEGANTSTSTPTASAAGIEVSAALLMGAVPTNKDGSNKSSGGVHNFPRFLENWSNKDVWIRGSLVALFESRVASEPWNTSFYSPPNRNWGFNDLFRQGIYPPGTPRVLSYRRVDYTDLTAAQYNAQKAAWGL